MYQVTVSVKDDQFNGVFTFPTLEKAVSKVKNSVYTGKSSYGISECFLRTAGFAGQATFWDEDEHLSYSKIEYVFIRS